MMVQSRIVHSDSCHPLCPTDNQQTQRMEEISQFEFVALCQMADNQNKTFYVKYLNNQAVAIKTHQLILSTGVWVQTLETVGDLIAACWFEPTRGMIGLPEKPSPFTLHTSETDETALEPDQPLSNMASGNTARTALIIKTKNDMEVDSSPTTSDSSRSSINREVIQIDSIDIHTEHLKRPDLLAKLAGLVAEYRFVRLTSPASSGKSSLLKLYQHSLRKTNVIWISCLDSRTCNQLLLEEGIDFLNKTTTDKIRKKDTVVFLDDAQAKYEDVKFWELLIKLSPNWLPSSIRFIISSTHLLSGGTSSPVEFKA